MKSSYMALRGLPEEPYINSLHHSHGLARRNLNLNQALHKKSVQCSATIHNKYNEVICTSQE